MNAYIKNYREALAKSGRVDDRPDDILTWEEGNWARQNAPQLFEKFPDFAAEWGQLRENNAPGLMEEGTRAFKRAGIGLGSTALGGAALITGSDYLKRKAAALSMQASDPDLAPTIPTLEDIRPGEDGPGQAFSRDTLRYGISKVGEAVPSIGEAVTLGLVGGAIGSAVEPGAGSVVGAGAGVVEGLIGRGIIRKAIKSLVSKQLSEEALIAGLRKGVPEVVEAVTKNAKSIAGARAGTVTAGLNSFVLNAGDVYAENDDRGVAAGLGLISAIPDTVLPALIVKKMFPGVSLKTGKEAARELVGSNALKVAKAAGVTGFEGATESFQEAVNVVARNLKNNVDPMTVTDDDRIRIREAGITGAIGGALASPAVVLERDAEDVTMAPEAPPAPPAAPTVAPLVPPVAPLPVAILPTQRVRSMSPEQQVARLAELEARARVGDEEKEYQILKATVPAVAVQPATPEAAAAVAQGNLPLAPTPVVETPLPIPAEPLPAAVTPPTTLPEPGAVATPQPAIATSEAVAPVQADLVEPVNIGDRSGRPTGAAEEAIVDQMRKDAGLPPQQIAAQAAPQQIGLAETGATGNVKGMTPPDPVEAIQLLQDSIATKRANNQKVPDAWIKRLGELQAEQRGEPTQANSIFSSADAPLRPDNSDSPVVPFSVTADAAGLASIEWRAKDAQKRFDAINKKIASANGMNRTELVIERNNLRDAMTELGRMERGVQKAIDAAPAPKSYGEKYIAEMGVAGAEARIADLTKKAGASRDPKQIENLYDEAANIRRALDKLKAQGEPPNAIREQIAGEGVLRPEQPQVGLPQVGQGNAINEEAAGEVAGQVAPPQDGGTDVGGIVAPIIEPEQVNLQSLSESRLLSLAQQLGIDPRKMSGDRLRARIESNARPEAIQEALGVIPQARSTQTATPEFQAWFGQSKVVDAEGKPLVVYHGTNENFSAPRAGGMFFTRNPESASGIAEGRAATRRTQGANVIPAYVKIERPYIYNSKTETISIDELVGTLDQSKYDGVIQDNYHYIPLSPGQVKSAIGNRGTFDPANPDITARTSTEPTNPAVQAQRTQEFQQVMGRMVANGANVQLLSQELLAQQTGEVLQQQIAALQQRLEAATTAPQRNELTKQIAIREQRMREVVQMRGVTFNPYHIAVAMDDVMNASLDNLVTLLHEAAESLTMRLTPAQQGAVFRAVEAASAQMSARMQAAAKNTGATVADVPVPSELLAETMAQTLAAEGISESASLAEAIVRWVKEIYYRVAMAAQKAFGAEPSISLTLDWYENQLRRELGGDYEYSLANLLDRFLPQPNHNFTAKFSGASGTPGGIPDFFDPTTQTLQQPWVEPLSDEALAWNMKFQTVGANPGESDGISAEEAVARQAAASYNDQIEWLTKLRNDIAPAMDDGEFLGLVSRGEKTPQQMLEALKTQFPDIDTAKIGGERMTDAMNKWAAWQSLKFMKGVQEKHLSRIASMQESVKEADERFTEHATELNRLEPDVRNAELHEAELKTKFRGILNGLLKSYGNGLRTASKLGGIEEMLNNEEGVRFGDPLPQFYAQAFANLLNADIKLFDYVEAIALLDLPIEDMTADKVWKAIRDNRDSSEKLQELSRNKPLAMTISVLAKNSARQLDQIQLRKADPATFLDVRKELEGIRNATEAQLREMIRSIDDKNKAKGLRQRLRTNYLKERRAMQRASDRIASVEERIAVLEKAKPAVEEKVKEMQQAIGGVFSEWVPFSGAEFTVMRRKDDGSYQKTSRTLEFKPDGSAVDADGLVTDLAMNWQWLKANTNLAGQREYEQVKHQTRELQSMDVQRAYPAHNYGKIMGMIDGFVRPLQAIAKQAGHASGNRIVQQFNKYGFILRSGEKALINLSYEWTAARAAVMKAVGIEDVGQFHARIYNPVMFYLGVNPGLDQSQAIRGARELAKKKLTTTPPANFNEKFDAFMLKDKQLNDELKRAAESNGVLVWDEKLGELRKALDRGWNTGMRMMNDGAVVTLINDMEKAGWKLEFDRDAQKQNKKVVTRSTTFDALNPKNATTPAERADYYSQLENTDALRAALKPYFTPAIIERWLLPFINKPGESVFSHDGRDISQLDLQNAWAKSGGDVVTWIDNLGQMIDISPEEDASDAATFRWDMLRQMEHLFRWEAKMAYEASQTPDLFDNQGSKLHVMMDARVNDLMPEEHVSFAQHDPTSVRQMLGQIAFHGAFGRNGMALKSNLTELEQVSNAKKFAFEMLRSTTVEGKKREAKERGLDYEELKRAVSHYHDVLELKGEIESAMGVKNIYGPLYDARAGMELLGFMVGQVVDQPKTAALNFLSIGARPFAMHSFSPKVLKATALAYGELAKNTFGGMLHDFGIDLVRESEYAKETGEVEGKAFRRLPWGTVFAGDTGKNGSFQDSLSQRFGVQPLRILRAFQKKGVGPGVAAIPGLGTMQRFATEGAKANNIGQIFLLQQIINNGIKHFSAHPEDLANPAFRFDASNLKLKADRGMYDWFRNKTVEYNMGPIEKIVRDSIARQQAGERTITTEMVEQLAQMNAQELDGASSINTAPAGLAQNQALKVMLPLLRWPLWMMHAAHEGLADTNGRADFKSMMRGLGRLAAWNLPLGLAFTFLIDEYDDKILKKKNAMPQVSPWAAVPGIGLPLALATSPRDIPTEAIGIAQRMIRSGNIYGLGGDAAQLIIAPFDPGSGQRQFSLDQRVLVMSQLLNMTQAIGNWFSQGVPTWGSVYRPMVASIGGNGMLNSLDVANNLLGLDNAEARLTQRINSARWINTAAKELGYETKKTSGFSSPTPLSVWTREMQLAAMANDRADFMEAYRKALDAAREKVAEDNVAPADREREAMQRVLAGWRARNPFSGLAQTPTPEQKAAMLRIMNDSGRTDVQDAMRYYDAYTRLIAPSEMDRLIDRRMRAADPMRQMETMRRRAAGAMMAQ